MPNPLQGHCVSLCSESCSALETGLGHLHLDAGLRGRSIVTVLEVCRTFNPPLGVYAAGPCYGCLGPNPCKAELRTEPVQSTQCQAEKVQSPTSPTPAKQDSAPATLRRAPPTELSSRPVLGRGYGTPSPPLPVHVYYQWLRLFILHCSNSTHTFEHTCALANRKVSDGVVILYPKLCERERERQREQKRARAVRYRFTYC